MTRESSATRPRLATVPGPRLVVLALCAALVLFTGSARAAESPTVQRTSFDHLTTGFELLGQHRDLPCESCHVNAIFKGTPRECQACHGVGTSVRASAKPANHLLTTNACAFCHTPQGWNPAVNFSHSEVMGSCASCHYNGSPVGGPGPNHIVTDLDCSVCHSTVGWAGAVFSHNGRTSGCSTCHDNVHAKGQPASHVPTVPAGVGSCEGCHSPTNYTTWHDVTGTPAIHATAIGWSCQSCHETAQFMGMTPSTATVAHDSRPSATLDKNHPPTGDCGVCHDTSSFTATASLRPANHIPTNAPCAQCHLTPGQNASYSVTGTHQGVTECLSCHAPAVATTFANVTIVTTPNNHIPIGSLDCNGSGCHSTSNVNTGGFRIGTASITTPTLNSAGHTTVAGVVAACTSCHETAPYVGMIASTNTTAGDSRPNATLDKLHPTAGDCTSCHSTAPTFAGNVSNTPKPTNHIPTSAPCAQCHTTAGNYAAYSVTGTHQGVTNCLSCHATAVANTFANVTIVSTPNNHFPIGNLDCNGSGCHSTTKVTTGGFRLGAASITAPTLSTAGHTTVMGQVPACTTCHETSPYVGMIASTASSAGDSRPTLFDKLHPTTGDCAGCHTTSPTFAGNISNTAMPPNHIPTSGAACTQCHLVQNNYASYSVVNTHKGVTTCLNCHAPSVAGTFANITIVSTPNNHIPIGSLDCNGSGCHSTSNVNAGGFRLGAASINSPTLSLAGHTTVAGQVGTCITCHETAGFLGMVASTSTTAGDSRPNATLDALHPNSGDCGDCHTMTPVFSSNVSKGTKPANHIPTTATCSQCHTTAGNFAVYSVTGTHQGVNNCLICHGPSVANTFANVTIVSTPSNHLPIGNLDCNGSGCHTTAKVTAGGFRIGSASISAPTLNTAGHATVAGQVGSCSTCHQTALFVGMIASSNTTAGDSRPNATLDKLHPTAGDCGGCHTTTPTFSGNQTAGAKPSNHIPTTALCTQCHTTAGNYAAYSVTATHQGVTNCLSCHAPSVANTFANVTIVSTPSNHMPIGNLDCDGSGCHTTTKVTAGGFRIGSASVTAPTLNVAGHTTVAGQVPACTSCHETAPYVGMIASSNTTAGDSRPNATLDKAHPTAGDCNGCHTTSPTFTGNVTNAVKPSNHIPTTAACAQCHTTAGNYAAYSVTGTHQGVTKCLTCHAPSVAGTFANITIVSTPNNHFPIGSLDCNGSGCHTTTKVTAGGFRIGAASVSAPTLTVAGHTTVKGVVPACTTCHETAAYVGMIASSNTTAGDSRPNATLDKSHPTTGDCGGCHVTTPTFSSNVTGGSKPSNHIPTTAACTQCHTTAGNYALYVMGATGHTGITKGCATCHAYGLSFANMAAPTLKQPPSGATGHIPSNPPNGTTLNVACELCHSPTNFTTFSGTIMRHAYVTSMKCMSCHEIGMQWKTNTGKRLWVRDSANHYKGQDCGGSGCHSSKDKRALRPGAALAAGGAQTRATSATGGALALAPSIGAFNHSRVTGTDCASCHNGAGASGKPADHIAVSNSCSSCHNTLAWLPVVRVDHIQVRGSCASCHNGKTARARSTNHIASSSSCETCHTTNAWTPARFDHVGVAAHTCKTCHDGVHAAGRPTNHVPTAAQCDTCHGTLGWKPAKVDHTTLTASCATCHNNNMALGIPTVHMTTRLDCATCHSYPDWTLVRYRHTSTAYPGDHKAAPACVACHVSNTDQIPWSSPANAGSCAGCHAKDFKPAAHAKTSGGLLYTANELHDCTGACHVYSDATLKSIAKPQPGPHHRAADAAFKH